MLLLRRLLTTTVLTALLSVTLFVGMAVGIFVYGQIRVQVQYPASSAAFRQAQVRRITHQNDFELGVVYVGCVLEALAASSALSFTGYFPWCRRRYGAEAITPGKPSAEADAEKPLTPDW